MINKLNAESVEALEGFIADGATLSEAYAMLDEQLDAIKYREQFQQDLLRDQADAEAEMRSVAMGDVI